MFATLDVEGFRSLRRLRVAELTRVNLFVGPNNCGKTSLLEATEVLATGTLAGLLRGPQRRGEQLLPSEADETSLRPPVLAAPIDLSHLFFGHRLEPGATLKITTHGPGPRSVSCAVRESGQLGLFEEVPSPLVLEFSSSGMEKPASVELSREGGLTNQAYRAIAFSIDSGIPVRFLGTEPTSLRSLGRLFDDILLTPTYQLVIDVLRIVEPRTEGVGFLSASLRSGGARVKLVDAETPLPLGSLGDGFRRLLGLALHLTTAAGGTLLVDEIDTGLHHSVMTKMWRLVIETARRLDVQVFATTHSEDCVRSLAEAAEQDAAAADDVSLHRIDPGEEETMRYAADDLIIATRRHIEVR